MIAHIRAQPGGEFGLRYMIGGIQTVPGREDYPVFQAVTSHEKGS